MKYKLRHGDCTTILPTLESASVDCVITDPPYPCIDRDYGRMSEARWHATMDIVVDECRRILKPTGSAVFILQANSEKVGRMRPWLWEFMAKWTREWGMIQDAWWWNIAAVPTTHCSRDNGLMRPSIKACVWLGSPKSYRCQDAVLWKTSDSVAAVDRSDRMLNSSPSGMSTRKGRMASVSDSRGGVTPFNVIPCANTNSSNSAGSNGHGAGTPHDLCDWWVRYICPPNGTVLDPFLGSGTVGIAALERERSVIGIEMHDPHFALAKKRIRAAFAARRTPQSPQ